MDIATQDAGFSSQSTGAAAPASFLHDVHNELIPIRNKLREFYGRLQGAGFYGRPQATPDAAVKPEQPDTVRHNIGDRLREIDSLLADIEHQLTQLA